MELRKPRSARRRVTAARAGAARGAPADHRSAGPAPACAFILFGGTGDLARRKLLPSLLALWRQGALARDFELVATAADDLDDRGYRAMMRDALGEEGRGEEAAAFLARARYVRGDFRDASLYEGLPGARGGQAGNRLMYLATPPALYAGIVDQLGAAGLTRAAGAATFTRLVVEKPFGTDLDSAERLNRRLHRVLNESQIYRIDHYLGKETVQNLLVFRFANGMFEPVWNRNYVAQVQITVGESIGIEGRGGYYEGAGALRDMVQNHLMQLLCLVAMEPPVSLQADDIRDQKVAVLRSLQPLSESDVARRVVRGQYTAGRGPDGPAPSYTEEPGVAPDSATETYVALQAGVDTWRWAGVPFYLRTGKHLKDRLAEIAVEFRRPPQALFTGTRAGAMAPNLLVLRIQPEEGIFLRFATKVPGGDIAVEPVEMDFAYDQAFHGRMQEAYTRLLLDALRGDPTLFTRADEVEASWRFIDPIRATWAAEGGRPHPYRPGTWGPAEAAQLLRRHGHRWRT